MLDLNILISKLYSYGLRGVVLRWLTKQTTACAVCWEKFCSEIPQGSVLVPKLSILYIDDIFDVSKIMQFCFVFSLTIQASLVQERI